MAVHPPRLFKAPHCASANSDRPKRLNTASWEFQTPKRPDWVATSTGLHPFHPVLLHGRYDKRTGLQLPFLPSLGNPSSPCARYLPIFRDARTAAPDPETTKPNPPRPQPTFACGSTIERSANTPYRINTLHITEPTPSRHDEQTNSPKEGRGAPQQLQLQRQRQQRPQQPPTHPRIRLRVRRGTTHGVARRRSTTCHSVG